MTVHRTEDVRREHILIALKKSHSNKRPFYTLFTLKKEEERRSVKAPGTDQDSSKTSKKSHRLPQQLARSFITDCHVLCWTLHVRVRAAPE